LYVINPLRDQRWDDFVARHSQASVFHQRSWLNALALSYGYEPFVLTSSPPDRALNNGVVFCRVFSWLTGKRLVSLPFADHCEPLLNCAEEMEEFGKWLLKECDRNGWRYIELRPKLDFQCSGFEAEQSYFLHELDLSPNLEKLFLGLHKDSIQRKVRRAEKEGLVCDIGNSRKHLDDFYRLLLMTRRRHRLFPQPESWFSNLVSCMGDKIKVRLARKGDTAIAAIVTLQNRSSVVYKYGCSDETVHQLGGMPFLFWNLIEESKSAGMKELDFGRSELSNQGLITFKDKFGAQKRQMTYCRSTNSKQKKAATDQLHVQLARHFVSVFPDAALRTVGKVFYKHIG
jgi:hypothetical protein